MWKKHIIGFLKYILLTIIILIILVPIIWIISLSLRYNKDVYEIFPSAITFKNYLIAIYQTQKWANIDFLRMFGNSFLVTIISLIGIIIISIFASFAFSNYKFKGKEFFYLAFIFGFLMPIQVLIIPLFVLLKNLRLLQTYLVLILPYIAIGFPIGILILRGFFEKIPVEIKEAAKIDGASDLKILFNIIIPISKPAIATVIIFNFLSLWNEFLFALIFLQKDEMLTIPVVLSKMIYNAYGIVQYEVYAAMIILTLIPVLLIFLFFQKWFIAGLTAGAVKG